MRDPSCVFCSIVAGSTPASVVREDADTLAFLDLRQPDGVHALVIPKAHVAAIDELDAALAAALMAAIVQVARALRRAFTPDGLSVWQSNGDAAGQEVFHVHVHLLTRRAGDGLLRIYPAPIAETERAALDTMAQRLRSVVADG